VDFFNKIKHVRSYSIYKHDTTLKMAFGANFMLANFNSGPPNVGAPAAVAPSNMTTLELERDDTPPCADTEEDSCMLKRILLWLWCYHSKTTYHSTLLRGAFSSTGLSYMVAPRRFGVRDLSRSAFLG